MALSQGVLGSVVGLSSLSLKDLKNRVSKPFNLLNMLSKLLLESFILIFDFFT